MSPDGDPGKKRLARKINDELDRFRPKWEDFEDIRSEEEIAADIKELDEYYTKKGISKQENRDKLTDGILVEKLFLDTDTKDIFGEEALYDELLTEGDDYLLSVIPAHEYDDTFNNADMICLVKNSLTDHQETIFVVDCTSNVSAIERKMGYRRTKENIRGFTDLKYFRNTNSKGEPESHTIEKVPRFIVGVDAELAREVLVNYNDWTKDEIDARYDRIRYYLLSELSVQAKGRDERLSKYFDRLLENFKNNHTIDDSGDFVFNRINEVAHSRDIGHSAIDDSKNNGDNDENA